MLHFLLKWQTYRNLKSGLLLDFLVKKLFHKISHYLFYTFTIFFGDKFVLEYLYLNFSVFFETLTSKVKNLNKNSFISFFRSTLFIVSYIGLVVLIITF